MRVRLSKIYRWLDSHTRWHQLRAIGASRMSYITILAPVVGYLLTIDKDLEFLENSWKFTSSYIGSVLFSAGTIIFSFRCPGACKKYDTAIEYTNAEIGFSQRTHIFLKKMIDKSLKRRCWPTYVSFEQSRSRNLYNTLRKNRLNRDRRRDTVTTLLDEYWHMLSPSYPVSRYVCATCFSVGSLLIGVPSITTAVQTVLRI